ncbi:A-kinase anchor protein 8-like isoform X1 [Amblyraja radiata]|uniref:A-kinase anchor protein 8-like isoform X1 n=1 Tax=Amblyraja radiata TaxID=386614 RepID=UPI001402BED5|nr:A-kinase anchor protein 8-like isoform X1 [Amblyraja radiata]
MDGRYGEYGEDDSWNAGGDDGQGYDGYDYNYNQDNSGNYSGNYGYNSGNKAWDAPKNPNTDSIVAKINQRLDMLTHLECDNTPGSSRSSGQFNRFTPYESYDSRSSMNDHDPYRSGYGYGYGDSGPNYNDSYGGHYDHYDNSYGTRRDQYHNRAYGSQRGQNWSRDWAPNRRANWNDPYMQPGSSRRMSAHWNEMPMGGRGYNAAPSTRNLPSLFSPNIIPMDLFRAQGSARAFGGRQRRRDKIRTRGRKKVIGGPGRKRKQSTSSTEDPENKQAKTDDDEVEEDAEDKEDDGVDSGGEDKDPSEKKPKRFPTMQEKKKSGKPKKNRDRLAERITYACSVCKFRTFEDEEIANHMKSKFHKETLKFIGTKLKPETADFLDEYISNKNKKTQKRREQIGDETILKKQLTQQHDVLQGIGMEQCMKKVEAAHCMACDLFIPMQTGFIAQHLRSAEHTRNRKIALERAKKGSLVIAKSILNNSNIATMLEKYVKGEKPFTDDPDDKDEEEGAIHEGEGDGEGDGLNDSTNDGEKKEGGEGEGVAGEGGEETKEGEGGEGGVEGVKGENKGEGGEDGEENVTAGEGIDASEEPINTVDDEMEVAEGDPEDEDLGDADDDAIESKDPEECLEADEDKILEGEDDPLSFDTELE